MPWFPWVPGNSIPPHPFQTGAPWTGANALRLMEIHRRKLILLGVLVSVSLAGCVYRPYPYGDRYYGGGAYGDRYYGGGDGYYGRGYRDRDYRDRDRDGRGYYDRDYDR